MLFDTLSVCKRNRMNRAFHIAKTLKYKEIGK